MECDLSVSRNYLHSKQLLLELNTNHIHCHDFAISTRNHSGDFLDCGPIRGIVIIRPKVIGYYFARPVSQMTRTSFIIDKTHPHVFLSSSDPALTFTAFLIIQSETL